MIQIPVNSRYVINSKVISFDDDEDEEQTTKKQTITIQEKAIYVETDALQIEMGNIVGR